MKSILIIGGNSEIAYATSKIFAQNKYNIHLTSRNIINLEIKKKEIELLYNVNCKISSLDIENKEDINRFLNSNPKTANIILLAAGLLANKNINDDQILNVNYLSHVDFIEKSILKYKDQIELNTIIGISSVAGDRGRASNYVYGSAKAMVTAFTSGLRQRLHKSNVTVVTIKPGFVDTPMTSEFKKGFLWVKPYVVAAFIVQAISKKRAEIYVPSFWWLIMLCVKLTPSKLFKKIKM